MITCTLQTSDGSTHIITIDETNQNKSISEIAAEAGIDIPVSCGSGACFSCGGRVLDGKQHLYQELHGEPLIDLDEDEFLTCIGGCHTTSAQDSLDHHVTIELYN